MRNRAKQKKEKGFTLLEMLVVIGLLVLVTTVAVPQFKKCFQDIQLNKTLDDLDSLLQATRSYYLVMNELPEDEYSGRVSEEVAWAMQSNFLGPIDSDSDYKGNFYYLTIKNYSGYSYDWDFWCDNDDFRPHWGILFNEKDSPSRNLFVNKMKSRFGSSPNDTDVFQNRDCLFLPLLEIPKAKKENRYY